MEREASNPRDQELVADLGWVQRLALSLARDRDAADDLAQDIARVWLEKRPVLADGPRGWLASVARKLALDRARSEQSRKARERSASKPEGEAFEVVERGARQRRVVEAVLQLAEPYRSTILYRYLDGLETREVAKRMSVPEATVRKRLERGLALLRERLDREFGSKSNAWAILLLEPGLRAAVLNGVGIMSVKWIAAAGVVVLLAGAAWYARGSSVADENVAVGGTGVVVPLEVAAAREQQPSRLENADAGQREVLGSAPTRAPSGPGLRGFIYVDEVRSAPSGLALQHRHGVVDCCKPRVDAADASWSMEALEGEPGSLWITSSSTVPALIPVPSELWPMGGVFDLHLSAGRTLELTLLDRESGQPLPQLEFRFFRQLVVERHRGRTTMVADTSTHRTDARGRATIRGIPLEGSISLAVDSTERERDVIMLDGGIDRMRVQREADWQAWLKKEQPAQLEQTVLISLPLGEACAMGQVPAWAIDLAGGAERVQVIARETTNETAQAQGMTFVVPRDAEERFELCANVPATLAVWLERTKGRERLSAETALTFAQLGPQDPIRLHELGDKKLTLKFIHVPRGEIQAMVHRKGSMADSVSIRCNGADFSREFTLAEDEQIQLKLRTASNAREKSGWTRQVKVDGEPEITIDLGGCERALRLDCPELGELTSESSIVLLRCEAGEASLDESVLVLCNAGRGSTAVHIPNGRWLYRYDDKDQIAVWGVVDVQTAAQQGEELVLRPRLRLAPLAEVQPGLRFDEIEGVSLARLPEKLRTASAKGGSERVALPLDAKYATLDGQK